MINPWRDTVVFAPREVRAFHALEEECGLDDETLSRFKDKFQFPDRVRVRLPCEEEWACHFFFGEVCFYEAAFLCGLRLPVHPFIMELFDDFGIALGQLMSYFLGIGGLGLSGICLRHSNIGSPSSFLYLGMTLRPPPMRFGVISQGCTTGGEP